MSETNLEQSDAQNDDTPPQDPFEGFTYQGSDSEPEEEVKEDAEADKESEEPSQEADSEEESSDKEEDKEEDKKDVKPKKSVQERIAEVTKKRREAERQAKEEAERRSTLEEENRLLKEKLGLTQPKEEDNSESKAPDPKDFEYGEFDEKYIAAREKYLEDKITAKLRAEQEQTRQTEAAERQVQERRELLDAQTEAGITKYDDFEEKVFEGKLNDLPPASEEAAELILRSENGADILYHFATNPEEAAQVLEKSPIEQALYIGKLEAKFSSEQDAPQEKPKPKAQPPKVPEPISRARGADGKFSVSDDTDDFKAFESKHRFKKRG